MRTKQEQKVKTGDGLSPSAQQAAGIAVICSTPLPPASAVPPRSKVRGPIPALIELVQPGEIGAWPREFA